MPVDTARLRATVEHLASFDRPSASDGERRAAEWIPGEVGGPGGPGRGGARGVPARVEEEAAVGSMAIPLALLSAAGVLAALGGRRLAPLGLLGAAGIVGDGGGGRRWGCSRRRASSMTCPAGRRSSAACSDTARRTTSSGRPATRARGRR